MFIVFAGRMATAKGRVINASRDAARAASIERSAGAAQHEAVAAAEATLADKSVTCRPLQVDVDTSSFGAGGEVAVTVHCEIELADLSLLAIPGSRTFERSEEHTSELQSLMRISYAVFCLKKTQKKNNKA